MALLGDAAFAVSLLAGQGSALAMTAAYVLAGELAKRAEPLAKPLFALRSRAAELYSLGEAASPPSASQAAFAPKTGAGNLCFRNRVINALAISGLARLAVGRDIFDKLQLPQYGATRKVGDGVNQAAGLISATASIPSLNFIPLTTFGNWF